MSVACVRLRRDVISKAKQVEKRRKQNDSLRVHAQPRAVLLHEPPQHIFGGLVDVGAARVLGEVAFEGDLGRKGDGLAMGEAK